jgi:methylmalonyl-CoA mutase
MADLLHAPGDETGSPLREWRHLAEGALKGRSFSVLQSWTRDDILIEPLYPPRADAVPLAGRGSQPWTLVQVIDDPDPERGNELALADISSGATGLSLRMARSPLAGARGLPASPDSLAVVLDGVDLAATHLRVDPAPAGPELAQWLADLVARRGIAPEVARISFGLDPVCMVLRPPGPADWDQRVASAFAELMRAGFRTPTAELDARPVHDAGGTEAQELAAILASAAWWLRAAERAGVSMEATFSALGASLSVDHDQFAGIAKIRALRLLWVRLQEICGVPNAPLRIHAETSLRMLARAGAQTNLVRATIAAFAAGIGGADSVAVLPYSAPLGNVSAADRTLARNTQHLLIEEARAYHFADAAAGSGLLEALTDAMAERAWADFQQIESEGGIVQSFSSGAFTNRVVTARDVLRQSVAIGATPLVGATIYRDAAAEPEPASHAAGLLALVRIEEMAAV